MTRPFLGLVKRINGVYALISTTSGRSGFYQHQRDTDNFILVLAKKTVGIGINRYIRVRPDTGAVLLFVLCLWNEGIHPFAGEEDFWFRWKQMSARQVRHKAQLQNCFFLTLDIEMLSLHPRRSEMSGSLSCRHHGSNQKA